METLIDKKPETSEDEKFAHIPGWGMDADSDDKPNYPMKHYTGDDHQRLNYARSVQQTVNQEVLHSIERPTLTRVFGTSTPPSGLSGKLRRYAFKFSEGSSAHWMTLLLADRVNVVEGIIDDLKHGYVPNLIAERGWKAEWKYNRKETIKKVAIGVAVTAAVITFMVYKNRRTPSLK